MKSLGTKIKQIEDLTKMITKTHVNRCILQNQNSKSKLQDKNY